jgi:tetratricopeptide (TPR) repeat protein
MKTIQSLTLGLALTAMTIHCGPVMAASTSELLQQGLYAEEVEGNLDAAIKAYGQVIRNGSAPRNQVAQALYRQGMCYFKLKDEAAARAALDRLVSEFPEQTAMIEKARPVLEDLSDFDPASLMPAGTLMYVELGSPGRQVETILNLLKGTPFENPLAAMAGPQGANGGKETGKSPGDIMTALLNPSMLAEFKKIHSSAVGITRLALNNPPSISVLYPGKSDALRGMILAALGVAGTPDKPIEGMQTVNIRNVAEVAYDDRVIIVARPPEQLAWSVKQYKGLNSDPSLATSNKSFARLSRSQRQSNALSVWANVDEIYGQLQQLFPAGQMPKGILSANAIGDFSHIDEFTLALAIEPTGLGLRTDLEFKDGHHCLAYDMIRTPNLSKAALEAVPSDGCRAGRKGPEHDPERGRPGRGPRDLFQPRAGDAVCHARPCQRGRRRRAEPAPDAPGADNHQPPAGADP